jgi:hypothetical protein
MRYGYGNDEDVQVQQVSALCAAKLGYSPNVGGQLVTLQQM